MVHCGDEIGVAQSVGGHQVNFAVEDVLQCFLQPEVAVKKAAGIFRAERNQKINVAVLRVKRAIGRRAEYLQSLYAKTAAQCGNFGAVLFDEVDHGVLSRGLCRQLPIHRLKHFGQIRAKQLVDAAHAALLGEGGVFEVVGDYRQIACYVFADHV